MTAAISQMTVADKLAEKIKNSELGALIDADDLDRIATAAIHKAFFEPRVNPDRYASGQMSPLIVEMATAQFRDIIKERLKPTVEALVASEEFTAMVLQAVSLNIPQAARECAQAVMYGAVTIATDEFNNSLPDKLRNVVQQSLAR